MAEEQGPVHGDVQIALEMIFDMIRDLHYDGACNEDTLREFRDLINEMSRNSAEASAQQSDDRTVIPTSA